LFTVFEPLFIVLALFIMLTGLKKHWIYLNLGQREDRTGDLLGLLKYFFGQRHILEKRWIGIAHLIVFWGFIIPLIIISLAQFSFTMPKILANLTSFLLDVLGFVMLAGSLFFLIKRVVRKDPLGQNKTILPLIVLLVILLTGFFAEGQRLNITHSGFSWPSPAGWFFSLFLSGSPLAMQIMIRIHFFAVLSFIALIPFTSMRHLVFGSLNVYYRKKTPRGAMRQVSLDNGHLGAGTILDFSWKQLLDVEACVACGRCEENCPAFLSGKSLSPRKVMGNILMQLEQVGREGFKAGDSMFPYLKDSISAGEIWSCTTCMACVEHCPMFIDPVNMIVDMRRYQVLGCGLLPEEAKPMMRNLEIFGDVNGKGAAHRKDWLFDQNVPHIGADGLNAEILLWVGCSGSFQPRYQETMREMVKILKEAGVRFGILGKEELCCGDVARKLGDEELFLDLALRNIASFKKYHVKKIVTLCPHGFNTMKNEYGALGGNFEVMHAIEFVLGLVKEKKISLKYPVGEAMTIHDPCYLGRGNRIYDFLRELMESVPGVRIKELRRNRENALCCGGGGGRMWLRENVGENISHLRAKEIKESGVQLVGTSCPFCLTMLEDGMNAMEMERQPKVMDIIEIVASSLVQHNQ